VRRLKVERPELISLVKRRLRKWRVMVIIGGYLVVPDCPLLWLPRVPARIGERVRL
jgi:hypothetical protein